MRRLRVVRVYKNLDAGGGVQTRLLELLPRLIELVDVRVLCYRARGSRADELEALGIPVDVIPMGSKWAPWNVRRYVKYFRQHRPDVVHTHEYTANTLAVYAAWKAGVPVRIRHLHSMAPWGWGGALRTRARIRSDRRAARRAHVTLAVSEAVREVFLKATGLPPSSCRVLYNGVDLSRYVDAREKGGAFRAELGIRRDAPVVGIVGRLSRGKGHETFLRVAHRVARETPGATFLVVGEGGRRAALEALASELGLGDSVVFAGYRHDVAAALGAMDVFLFTSSAEGGGRIQDGLPGAVIEAMAAGVPVVAFELPMMKEVLGTPPCGALVPEGDWEKMVDATVTMLRDRAARCRAGEAARSRAERFALQRTVRETVQLYRELAQRIGT